jgi:hypothetical protein
MTRILCAIMMMSNCFSIGQGRKSCFKQGRIWKQIIRPPSDVRRVCIPCSRVRSKCDGTLAETRFRLSAKWTSPFKSAGASVQPTTNSRGVRISGSNAGYTMFRDSVKGTGYTLHSPVSTSLPLPCVIVYHHISTGQYIITIYSVK